MLAPPNHLKNCLPFSGLGPEGAARWSIFFGGAGRGNLVKINEND